MQEIDSSACLPLGLRLLGSPIIQRNPALRIQPGYFSSRQAVVKKIKKKGTREGEGRVRDVCVVCDEVISMISICWSPRFFLPLPFLDSPPRYRDLSPFFIF
jgi:hypothetical protein